MMTLGGHGGWQVTETGGRVHDQMYGRFLPPDHQEDFVDTVKPRRVPSADVAVAHNACVMVHMANIAYRLGNVKLRFDSKTERFIDNDAANALFKRAYRAKYEIPENV